MTLRRLRWPHWLALIALLWATLSPALARVVLPTTAQDRIEICTSTGVVRIVVDAAPAVGTDPAGAPAAAAGKGCDWCPWQASLVGLPPASAGWLTEPAANTGIAPNSRVFFLMRWRWAVPSSRAPPASLSG